MKENNSADLLPGTIVWNAPFFVHSVYRGLKILRSTKYGVLNNTLRTCGVILNFGLVNVTEAAPSTLVEVRHERAIDQEVEGTSKV